MKSPEITTIISITALIFIAVVISAPQFSTTPQFPNWWKIKIKHRSTNKFFDRFPVRYTGKHDIVKIDTPINKLNQVNGSHDEFRETPILFFIEGDIKGNGTIDYRGLYMLKILKNETIKLMDTARDVTSEMGDNKNVFVAASDGLYIYNTGKKIAERYGTVNGSFIDIEKPKSIDIIYALNDKYELFKITDNATKVQRMDIIRNAREIIVDNKGNLFYSDSDKNIFAICRDIITRIEGLPEKMTYVKLVKPMFEMEEGVLVFTSDKFYCIYANGTSILVKANVEVIPTAFDISPFVIQYLSYEKNIYEVNIFAMVIDEYFKKLAREYNIF